MPSGHSSHRAACYATTVPGLEIIAAREIEEMLGAEIKRTEPGLIVFRPEMVDRRLLGLRTVEDVFLLAWGSDALSHRAVDLEKIERWTAREGDWPALLQLHHAIRPKPKGKPTYHLVTQMQGEHGYRRVDARQAFVRGLAGKIPASWRLVDEDASLEVWLTIDGARAVCGLRLSDKSMRHRTYKEQHLPASLRPVVAAAMVRLAGVRYGQLVLDPMCGAGTIIAECLAAHGDLVRPTSSARGLLVAGGDIEPFAVRAAAGNLRRLGQPPIQLWDARSLPFADKSVDRIICNPPFGKQLGKPAEIGPLYESLITDWQRVLKPGGRAVLLVSEIKTLETAIQPHGWKREHRFRLRVLGQPAFLTVWHVPA